MAGPLFGVGFRTPHAEAISRAPGAVDWFEVLSDNYLGAGGPRRKALEQLRIDHPLALHGVSLSIAASEPLDDAFLKELRELAHWVDPDFVSDHLCWTAFGGFQSHDLLPLAYTPEVLRHVAARVARVQDALGRRILLENPSAYVAFRQNEIGEAEFLAELCRETGCGVLLDVNNLLVNAANLGVDPVGYLATLPGEAVGYMHLAGHAVLAGVRIDTHDADVPDPVWELFEAAVSRFPEAGVIIERDDRIPPFESLAAEVDQARVRHERARGCAAQPPRARGARRRGAEPSPGPTWSALQRDFWSRLVDKPLGFEGEDLGGLLADDLPVRAARGMRVYSDAYTASLRAALATNFAALARVIAPVDFERLTAAYLRAHPPSGHGFRALGDRLAEFVRSYAFESDYGVPPEALADLVALEQAQLEVQDAPDGAEAVAPEALARIRPGDWEGARFAFAPALRVLRAAHDVAPAVEAAGQGRDPERPLAGEVAYLVYRAAAGVRSERLAPRSAALLEALLTGASFGEACLGDGSAGEEGARLLVLAASHGLLTRVVIE